MIRRVESKEHKADVFIKVLPADNYIISGSYSRDGDYAYLKARNREKRTK